MTQLIASILAAGGLALVAAAPSGACESKKSCTTEKTCETAAACDTDAAAVTAVADTSDTKSCDTDKSCDSDAAAVTQVAASGEKTCDTAKSCDTKMACKTDAATVSTVAMTSTESSDKKMCDTAKACDTKKACDTDAAAVTQVAASGEKTCDTAKSCDTKMACGTEKTAQTTQVANTSEPKDAASKESASKDSACCALMEAKNASTTTVAATAAPAADAYDTAAWPAHNDDLYAKDVQGKALPTALGKETWLTDKVDTKGKVVVLDFWATWCGPCIAASPKLDKLQKDHADNLAVLAIAGQRDPIDNVRSYVEENPVAYSHLYDADQSVFKPLESKGIPLVVVMSTDGTVRWMGNPHEPDFLKAVNAVLKADPMIEVTEG